METRSESNPERKIDAPQKELVVMEARKKGLTRGIWIFWMVSSAFIFLRFFLEAIGSDPRSFFVAFIYTVSGLFLLPFFGIFPDMRSTIRPGEPTFDPMALTAIFCYTILVFLAVGVVHIGTKMFKTRKQVDVTVEKGRPIDPTLSEKIVK